MKPQKSSRAKITPRNWVQIDVSKQPMGRAASVIANLLRGKHKRDFTPNLDGGDYVVAVNTGKLKLSGRKVEQKVYYRHSGYLGGLRKTPLKNLIQKNPSDVLRRAVFSMLDDVKFRKAMIARLKLVKDETHNFKVDKAI
ncbi:MAG: 50S ribosomal protein L13 [Patescibacteria group bacterium]|nr:50S ribosomal protein L13 [Patescibacteria group bacterium]